MLTKKQQDNVDAYTKVVNDINKEILRLSREKDAFLLELDEEYANHLERMGEDSLSISAYYKAINEFDELMKRYNEINSRLDYNDPDEDFSEMDDFEKENNQRFAWLERKLGL